MLFVITARIVRGRVLEGPILQKHFSSRALAKEYLAFIEHCHAEYMGETL